MTKINPCPICGSEPDLNVGYQESWVVCRSCGVAVASGTTTGDAAINGWNDVTANFKQPAKALRDEFAMAALIGMQQIEGLTYADIASGAYGIADAMIKERSK